MDQDYELRCPICGELSANAVQLQNHASECGIEKSEVSSHTVYPITAHKRKARELHREHPHQDEWVRLFKFYVEETRKINPTKKPPST